MDSRHCNPLFQPTDYRGPKLVCIDLTTDQVIKKILFPQNVALPTTYLNDVRFDLRRGSEGMAFITDSAQKGPNGVIVVDLASGESWRRLHDHPSTKAEELQTFLPIVEGRLFLEHQPNRSEPWCWHGLGRHHEDAQVGLLNPLCSAT